MSRGFVIRLEGTIDLGGDTERYIGSYVKRFDFEGCEPGECNLDTVADAHEALVFDSQRSAVEYYTQTDPRAPKRTDGQPNRPLTIFSVGILPIEQVLAA